MHWILIALLSGFGLVMGIASLVGLTGRFGVLPVPLEPMLWLVIALCAAAVLARRLNDRRFLHGFLAGWLMSMWNGLCQASFLDLYLQNNPEYADRLADLPSGADARVFIPLVSAVIGGLYGLLVGAASWLAGRTRLGGGAGSGRAEH
jgi:lysylphosphatidylglycerol synthetase-like protein (DUF2156 family)